MRIIASMTTIPSRIGLIRPVVEAVLSQTAPVERLEMNIPYVCRRDHRFYDVPDWLEGIPGVQIFRTDDQGPITKIAPTLLRYREDHETYLWSVDDDCAYPPDQLSLLCRAHSSGERRILTRYGGFLSEDGVYQSMYGHIDVNMFEGFGGVLYPPACVGGDFRDYVATTSASRDCRANDDIVLSIYFNGIGMPIRLYNLPSEETPYMVPGWMPHSRTEALVHAGHPENFKRIHSFLKDLRWHDRVREGD